MTEGMKLQQYYGYWLNKQRIYLDDIYRTAIRENRRYDHGSALLSAHFRFYEQHPDYAEVIFTPAALDAMRARSPHRLRKLMAFIRMEDRGG